ncbi:hypothetical protein [Rhodobacteraceae bacterium DSL-40]|uniref:hypothetical protein n=1 Tax=Amaricoccus sp. B4 TaxID=3368557 RepID=UPI000DABFB5D
MPHSPPRYTPAAVLFLVSALAGLGISLYLYLVPLTGVTGSFGAMLVAVACGLLAIAGLVMIFEPAGEAATLFRFLGFIGAACTAAAAWFLHSPWLLGAMIAALVFVLFDSIAKRGYPA